LAHYGTLSIKRVLRGKRITLEGPDSPYSIAKVLQAAIQDILEHVFMDNIHSEAIIQVH